MLRLNNAANDSNQIHAQNVFLSRILFCYFAEDTGIFEPRFVHWTRCLTHSRRRFRSCRLSAPSVRRNESRG
ncbi:type IIL restriction-modification enzyme MmeI [Pseudomonas gessardii]|uniref:type IIL restriction-modification enzyme MmeI n=1 Tax=Pseudomonas gessardii TaxID=78544 RepID=UPI003CC80754